MLSNVFEFDPLKDSLTESNTIREKKPDFTQ